MVTANAPAKPEQATGKMHAASIDKSGTQPNRLFVAMWAERRIIDHNGRVLQQGKRFGPQDIHRACGSYNTSTVVSAVRGQLPERFKIPDAVWFDGRWTVRLIEHLPPPEPENKGHFAETGLF